MVDVRRREEGARFHLRDFLHCSERWNNMVPVTVKYDLIAQHRLRYTLPTVEILSDDELVKFVEIAYLPISEQNKRDKGR